MSSDATERIASVVADALHESPSGERIEAVAEQVVTDVLAIVREALLSDASVDGMLQRSFGWLDYDKGTTYEDLPENGKEWRRDEGRHELLGALDAAFGADDDGGES